MTATAPCRTGRTYARDEITPSDYNSQDRWEILARDLTEIASDMLTYRNENARFGREFLITAPATMVEGKVRIPGRYLDTEKGALRGLEFVTYVDPDATLTVEKRGALQLRRLPRRG
jgi:hypothetical protein